MTYILLVPHAMAQPSPDNQALIDASVRAVQEVLLGNCGSTHSYENKPWTLSLEDKALNLTVFTADGPPGSANRRFKGVCMLPYPPRKVLDVLDDSQGRLQWDRNIKSLETVVLQEAPFKACLLCSCTKNVGIISGRDFIDVPVYLEYKDAPSPPAGPDAFVAPLGSLINGGHGIPSHPLFPEKSGVVRGWNSPGSGWLFEPVVVEGGEVHTRVHYLIHVDLKGWIPTALVNSSLSVSAVAGVTFAPFFLLPSPQP